MSDLNTVHNKQEGKKEMEEALRTWGLSIQTMLDERYGATRTSRRRGKLVKSKVGYLLMTFEFSNNPAISWISSAQRESVIAVLTELLNRLKQVESSALLLPEHKLWEEHFGG